MKKFIQVKRKDLFLLNVKLLGLNEAQLWISEYVDGPTDNDDERVLKDRMLSEQEKGRSGRRISGIEAVNLTESVQFPGWFEVNTVNWEAGIYRLNIHSKPYVQAPFGTPLRPIRDGQYSWPNFSDEALLNFSKKQRSFLYLERNNAGFCIRIEITNNREIIPAGDGLEWIDKWPEIKKKVENHYKKN